MSLTCPEPIVSGDRCSGPHPVGTLGIAGMGVELWADAIEPLAPFLAAHRHFDAGAEGNRLRVEVLAEVRRPARFRIRFPDLTSSEVRALIDRGAGGRLVLLEWCEADRSGLYGDYLLGQAPVLRHGPDGCDILEPRLLGSYLELLLLNAALDRAPHLAAAHAGVVAVDGRAALVCGDSGAGKTTLTLALLGAGCAYLSDEVALIDVGAGTVQAYPRSLGVRDGTRSLMPLDPGRGAFRSLTLAGDPKSLLDPATVAVAGVCREARLDSLWFLAGFATEARIVSLDPWQAARRLARSLRHARGSGMDRLWTALEVTRRCRAWEITPGAPAATADALIRRLKEEGGYRIA